MAVSPPGGLSPLQELWVRVRDPALSGGGVLKTLSLALSAHYLCKS